jgi:chromosome segregation ATPase
VKAVIDALRAEGAKPTIDKTWEALGKVGSKGTVHKLVKQYFSELDETEKTPESLRLLPPGVQQVILAFADEAAAAAREKIAAELLACQQEAASSAGDNEQLVGEVDDLRTQLAHAASEKAVTEGRTEQLARELAAARNEIRVERMTAEQARIALARAELRIESVGVLEEELREARAERDALRGASTEAQQAAAVCSSRQTEYESRVQELKSLLSEMRDACARFERKHSELAEAFDRERQARAIAERDLAVLTAIQAERPSTSTRSRKRAAHQGALWHKETGDPSGN